LLVVLICILEKEKKYSWILLDSNRKSVNLTKGLFNKSVDAIILVNVNKELVKANDAGKKLLAVVDLDTLLRLDQIKSLIKKCEKGD